MTAHRLYWIVRSFLLSFFLRCKPCGEWLGGRAFYNLRNASTGALMRACSHCTRHAVDMNRREQARVVPFKRGRR